MINTPNHPNAIRYQEPYEYGSSPTMYSPTPAIYRYPIPYRPFYGGGGEAHSIEDESDKSTQFIEQQRRIQFLEEELNRKKETISGLQSQITKYEQEKQAEKKKQSRYWTPEEHTRFLEALSKYGHKDVKSIANYVATRNATQVRTHAQKYFLRIDKERQRKMENKDDKDGSSGKEDGLYIKFENNDYNDEGSPLYSGSCGNSPTSNHQMPNPFPNSNGSTPTAGASASLNGLGHLHSPSSTSSPISKRKRETVTITASQAKNALLYKDAVLAVLPISWSPQDYDGFSRGLLAHIDQDDIHNLCKLIKDQFLPNQSIESIEAAYHAFHKAVQQKVKDQSLSNSTNTSPNLNQSCNSNNLNLNSISNSNSSNNLNGSSDSNRSPMKKRPPPLNVPRSEYPVTQVLSSGNSSNNNSPQQSVSPNISSSQSSSPIYLHQQAIPQSHGYLSQLTPNYSGLPTPVGMMSIHPNSPSLNSAPMRWPQLYDYNLRRGVEHMPMTPQTPHGHISYIPMQHGNAPPPHLISPQHQQDDSSDSSSSGHPSWSSQPFSGNNTNNGVDSPSWQSTIQAFSNTSLNSSNNNSTNNSSPNNNSHD